MAKIGVRDVGREISLPVRHNRQMAVLRARIEEALEEPKSRERNTFIRNARRQIEDIAAAKDSMP